MNYVITSNGELYHYGVPGMKWGRRKARLENRTSRRFARAGRIQGRAEYQRSRAAEIMRKHDSAAIALEKQAKAYDKQGGHIKAEIARKSAEAIRQRGVNAKANNDSEAARYEKKANKALEKANKYATKKNVDLGKKRVNSILNDAKKKGYESEKSIDEFDREQNLRNKLGDKNYERYNTVRGLGNTPTVKENVKKRNRSNF